MRLRDSIIPILCSALLVLALGRCSPIAPSYDKSLVGSFGRTDGSSGFAPIPLPNAGQLRNPPAQVLDGETYQRLVSAIPSNQRVQLSDDDFPNVFAALKQRKEVELRFSGLVPDSAQALCEVALPDSAIASYGLTPIQMSVSAVSGNTWMISVSPSVPDDVWARIANSLNSVTISVDNASQLSVVDVAPEAAATPAPSASPSANP